MLSKSEANEILKHMHETTGKLVTAAPGRKTVASGFCLDAGLFPENVKVRSRFAPAFSSSR